VERWLTQPLPRLQRLRTSPDPALLRGIDFADLWSSQRLLRRAKGQDAASWVESIQALVDSQLYGDAQRELREAVLAYPDSADTHLLQAQVFEKQKNFEDAVRECQAAIKLRPAAESFVTLARIYRAGNQNLLALASVEQALKLDPDHAAAQALKAELQKPPGKRLDP
jgi:tetratricopeptide (TPR) repeat protein